VKSTLVRPDGSPVVGQCVIATLMSHPAWLQNHSGQVLGQVRTNTDSTGVWRMNLLPYTEFETSNYVYYEIVEGRGMPTWLIRVPPEGMPPADRWMRDLLIEQPPVQSGAWTAIHTLGHLHNVDTEANKAPEGYVLGTYADGNWGMIPNALPALLDVDEESVRQAKPGDQLVMLPNGKWGVFNGPFVLDVEWVADESDINTIFITVHGGSGRGARVSWGDASSPRDAPPEEPVRHVYPGPGTYTITARDKAYPTAKGTAQIAIGEPLSDVATDSDADGS
jgi:hypothetical protein